MGSGVMVQDRGIGRRRAAALLGVGLAAPMVFVRRAWAQGKAITIGTYTGPQGEFVRREVIPKFQSDFGCRVFQTQGVTLGQISILRTQKSNPTYSVMFMDDVGVPVAREEDLIVPLPRDKMPNLAHLLPRFLLNDGFAAAFGSPWWRPTSTRRRSSPSTAGSSCGTRASRAASC